MIQHCSERRGRTPWTERSAHPTPAPAGPFGALGPAIGSLVNDQQHTDYIVFPLFAGVLARCVLASRASAQPTGPTPVDTLRDAGIFDHARLILKLADAATGTDGWERDRDAFTTIVQFVVISWDVFLSLDRRSNEGGVIAVTGLMQIFDAKGTTTVEMGTVPAGVGVVRVGPVVKCQSAQIVITNMPACMMGLVK